MRVIQICLVLELVVGNLFKRKHHWQRICFHCAAHRLNLAVVSACSNQTFKNTESCVGEMARFFHCLVKRQHLLDKAIHLCLAGSEVKAKKLKDACRTLWV